MENKDGIPACFTDGDKNGGKSIERLKEMFVDVAQESKISNGQKPAERAVFRKLHGVAHGRLEMLDKLPKSLHKSIKVGVFAKSRLDAWVRFSSDTKPTTPDLGTTVGIGIKLFGVPGENALGEQGDTADFIMQNYPVFFVDTAKDMAEFTHAGVVNQDYQPYLDAHPKTKAILKKMGEKVESSVLTTTYWGILPFHAGEKQYVKYRLDPETPPENVPSTEADYLAVDMAQRLARREYRFRFMVQVRTGDDKTMPLDQATVEWPVADSEFAQVGTLILSQQDICARGQAEYGQGLSYNIWRVPAAQRPVGSIAEARKVVYAASARKRFEANGQPLEEPVKPRPADADKAPLDTCIVKAVIYPSIGIARVGTSDAWFIGPEVPNPPAQPAGTYRHGGQLKRQAARFRVYGVNTRGEIVRELDASNAKITWKVELANTKSAWYAFQLAQDIPEAASAAPTTLRNPAVADRKRLAITPGARTVTGVRAKPQAFDSGKFMDKPVYLGEITTDEAGHLIVVGGRGAAASYDGSRAITFANNEGWHDDVSDGPVTASVKYLNQELDVTPAWAVVAPPNYGPQRKSVRTMWDLMRDLAIQNGWLPEPARPSFSDDILPIFERLNGLQWVNAGFASGFGWNGVVDLTSEEALSRLSSADVAYADLRRSVALQFRNPAYDGASPKPWPWIYGDAMSSVIGTNTSPRQNVSLSDTQLAMLAAWAKGDFVEDYAGRKVPQSLDDVPLAQRGDTLTRAALDFCLADAFHPGCEMTWPVRMPLMYMAPFRFRHAPEGWVAPEPEQVFTLANLPNGPLAGQQAGGITRWMAVPWQTDTASCRSGYDKNYDPYLPTFWPARVPNQVLTRENYDIVMNAGLPIGQRRAAFASRAAWIDPLGSESYTHQINNMIAHFDHLGVVEALPGPTDKDKTTGKAYFPAVIEVEDQHRPIPDLDPDYSTLKSRSKTKPKDKARDARPLNPLGVAHGPLGHAPHAASVQGGSVPAARADSVDIMQIEKVRRFPRGLKE